MARNAASSVTARPPATRRRLMAKVISPGMGANSASHAETRPGSLATRAPAASERPVSLKPSGSTARISTSG